MSIKIPQCSQASKNVIVQKPCALSDYKAVKATNNMGGDKAIFKLVVDEMVKVKEEYLVYDTVSMISVVGGFMGLCVGLSFYDASGILLRCLEITLIKWKRKFRENKNVEELSVSSVKPRQMSCPDLDLRVNQKKRIQLE